MIITGKMEFNKKISNPPFPFPRNQDAKIQLKVAGVQLPSHRAAWRRKPQPPDLNRCDVTGKLDADWSS